MFSLPSGCREFPAEPVGQIFPQVDRRAAEATTTAITIQIGMAEDAEILTRTGGLMAPVVLEVQEVRVDRVAPEGLADQEALVDLEVAEEGLAPIRSTTESSFRPRTCRRSVRFRTYRSYSYLRDCRVAYGFTGIVGMNGHRWF